MSSGMSKRIVLLLLDNIVWPILFLIYISFLIISPKAFLSIDMLKYILYTSAITGVIVLAEAIALLSGNFDLSVGELAGLSAMVGGVLAIGGHNWSIPIFLVFFIPIIVGIMGGALNGVLVGTLGLNPFLATLGTFMVFSGLKLIVSPASLYTGLPKAYLSIGSNLYATIGIFIFLIIVIHFILTSTAFGSHLLSVGSDPVKSYLFGIGKNKIYFLTFLTSGALCGIGGLLMTGFMKSVPTVIFKDYVFICFAACALAGISLRGGKGNIINIIGGVLLYGVIEAGTVMFNVSPFVRTVIFGILVIFAIIISGLREKMHNIYMTTLVMKNSDNNKF